LAKVEGHMAIMRKRGLKRGSDGENFLSEDGALCCPVSTACLQQVWRAELGSHGEPVRCRT